MLVRAGHGDGSAGARTRFVRGHRQGVLRADVGRPRRQHRPDHRAADDLHSVRGRMRRPDDRHLPRGRDRHPQLDDANRHISVAPWLPQVPAACLRVELLVHDVSPLHQRDHHRLLHPGDW